MLSLRSLAPLSFWIVISVATSIPLGSWDSHIHIIDPERFPLSPDRDYTPKPATVQNCTEFQGGRGIHHAVVVLPSVYGTNNSVLVDALRYFRGQYRGVAVIDPDTITDEELDEMHGLGVRGVRVFTSEKDENKVVQLVKANAAIAARRNWVVQLWLPLRFMTVLHSIIPKLNSTFAFDHYGHLEVGSKTNNTMNTIDPYRTPGFTELIDLVQRKMMFVKISAPYQNSKQSPLYEDMRVVAEILINAGPDMVVYASDWPHTSSKEGNGPGGPLVPSDYRDINDTALVEITKEWAGSAAQVQRIFVDNPRRLWQWYIED